MTANQMTAGEEVVLQWGGFEGFGLIKWTEGQLAGVSFIQPVEWETVLATRRKQDTDGMSAKAAQHWIADRSWKFGKALL